MDMEPRLQGQGDQTSPGVNTSTPSSTTSARAGVQYPFDNQAADDPDNADAKKARACEACRGLKVRCDPDPNDGPCRRCKKAGRNCVVTMPTRKRQKKTDSRVSELEKKIDALTASLHARVAPGASHSSDSPTQPRSAPTEDAPWNGSTQAADYHRNAQAQLHADKSQTQKRKASDYEAGPEYSSRAPPPSQMAPASWPSRSTDGDVVDRGLVPSELASELFLRYTRQMAHNLPGIIFPPTMTVADLRRTKPILFHAVMAAASGENHSLQRVLQKELMYIFAEKVIVTGEKSLELVQALCVAVIWYWPPEYYEELKFYQLIHIACVMAIDIGLGRKTANKSAAVAVGWRENPRRAPLPDPTTLESRRTWLTCFYLASNTAMSLHRPNLIRWTPFMSESQELLQTSPNAAPSDKYFCHLVWTHHLGEEAGVQFSMDDPSVQVSITDSRTQYSLRVLERDLDRYIASVPKDLMRPTLKLGFDVLNLYMHEMVLHSEPGNESLRPPFDTDSLKTGLVKDETISAPHVNAISACLKAIEGIFETFLVMDIDSIRCLPVFNFVRVAYAVVVLMKMHFSAMDQESELGAVIGRENMRVQHYLDTLLDKFRLTAADDKCRPASKFLVVLAMLRSWFVKQGKPEPSKADDKAKAKATPAPAPAPTTQPPPNPPAQNPYAAAAANANTPLQLLSEVATGHDGSANWTYGATGTPPQPMFRDAMSSGSAGQTPPMVNMGGDVGGQDQATMGFPSWLTQNMLSDLDFSSMVEAGNAGVRAVDDFSAMNQAWYMNAFQGLPDPNLFPF